MALALFDTGAQLREVREEVNRAIAGVVVGLLTGALMPVALHYGVDDRERHVFVAPSAGDGQVSLSLIGVF